MALNFTLALSTDEKFCHLAFPEIQKKVTLTASDLETMITSIAQMRMKMLPAVREPGMRMDGDRLLVDAESPRTCVALQKESPACVVVAIAFPGLGSRSLALSLPQAQQLGQSLLAASAGVVH
jgi:hypothetical protein